MAGVWITSRSWPLTCSLWPSRSFSAGVLLGEPLAVAQKLGEPLDFALGRVELAQIGDDQRHELLVARVEIGHAVPVVFVNVDRVARAIVNVVSQADVVGVLVGEHDLRRRLPSTDRRAARPASSAAKASGVPMPVSMTVSGSPAMTYRFNSPSNIGLGIRCGRRGPLRLRSHDYRPVKGRGAFFEKVGDPLLEVFADETFEHLLVGRLDRFAQRLKQARRRLAA